MPGDGISTAGVLFPALNFVLKTFRTGVELSIESTEDREVLNTIDKASSDVLVAAGLLNKKGHALNSAQKARLEEAIRKTENALDRLRTTIEKGKNNAPNRSERKQDQKRLSVLSQNETLKASERLTTAHQELLEQIDFVKSKGSARTSTDTQYLDRSNRPAKTASYVGTDSPPPSYVQTSISPREEREQYLRQASARLVVSDRALPSTPSSPLSDLRAQSPITPPSGGIHSQFAH